MARYHINPQTGDAGVCRAEKACPFGDLATDHYESLEKAREMSEKKEAAYAAMRDTLAKGLSDHRYGAMWVDVKGGKRVNGRIIEFNDESFLVQDLDRSVRIPFTAVNRMGLTVGGGQVDSPGKEQVGSMPASYFKPGMTWNGAMIVETMNIGPSDPTYHPSRTLRLFLSNGASPTVATHHELTYTAEDRARFDAEVPVEYLDAAGVPDEERKNFRGEALTWQSLPSSRAGAVAKSALSDFEEKSFKLDWE